jgi:hypothetical protein
MMMEENWDTDLDDTVPDDHYYRPTWWYGSSGSGGGGAKPVVAESTAPDTSFSDIANSITGRFESASETIVGGIDGFAGAKKGGIDLSAVDTFTKNAFESALEGAASGGGGGGGCACACAGCACACACAGGGR